MDGAMRFRAIVLFVVLVAVGMPARTSAQQVTLNRIAGIDRELLAACRWAQTRSDEELRQRAERLWKERARLLERGARSQLPPSCRQRLAGTMGSARVAGRGSKGSKGYSYRRAGPPVVQTTQAPIPPPTAAPRTAPRPVTIDGGPEPPPARRPAAANGGGPEHRPAAANGSPTPPSAPLPDMFPWPPPTASTRHSFSPDVVVGAPAAKNLGEAATRLEGLLQQ